MSVPDGTVLFIRDQGEYDNCLSQSGQGKGQLTHG